MPAHGQIEISLAADRQHLDTDELATDTETLQDLNPIVVAEASKGIGRTRAEIKL